jgi:hypothetical protein
VSHVLCAQWQRTECVDTCGEYPHLTAWSTQCTAADCTTENGGQAQACWWVEFVTSLFRLGFLGCIQFV